MVIILAICIPVTAIVTGFFVLKAVQLGLRWQIQTAKQEQPTMDKIENPLWHSNLTEKKEEPISILNEWLNGADERR